MKLAEALVIRADLQKKINQLSARLMNNATVQEGEKPAENPAELFSELESANKQLIELITKINLTNAEVKCGGRTLTELLAERDCLSAKITIYKNFLNNASCLANRTRGSEIKVLSTVNVADMQKKVDSLAADLRRLELTIQEVNWTNEVL